MNIKTLDEEKHNTRFLWKVNINNTTCRVYRVGGLEHDFGINNHQDPELWVV